MFCKPKSFVLGIKPPFLIMVVCFIGISTDICFAQNELNRHTKLVSEVYPTASELPDNLLRFYVYFSKPMERGDVLQHIHLIDGNNREVTGVFLSNKFDLWSPNSKRLTLLLDPGRVKTGLKANKELGRALFPGKNYRLVISAGLEASDGTTSLEFSKTFTVTESSKVHSELVAWPMTVPSAGSKEALKLELGAVFDHLSLAYRIRVKDSEGNTLRGKIELPNNERSWHFVPEIKWPSGNHTIVVDPKLEDVAGNRLTGLFESTPSDQRQRREPIERRFEIE